MYLLLPNTSVVEYIYYLCYTHKLHSDGRKLLLLTFTEVKSTKINYQ